MDNKSFIVKIDKHSEALSKYLKNEETEQYFERHKLKLRDEKIIDLKVDKKDIEGGVIINSFLQGVIFSYCDASGMYLFDNIFDRIHFEDVNLRKCEFNGSRFISSLFKNCNLSKCDFTSCTFQNVVFDNCSLAWSSFINVDIRETTFNNVSLEGAIIADSKMFNSNKHTIDFGKNYPAKITNVDISHKGDGSEIVGFEGLRKYLT